MASWTFRDGGDGCFAAAGARGAVFQVAATRTAASFSLQALPRAPAVRGGAGGLRFQGAAGSWTVQVRSRGRVLQGYAPLTEESAGRVLVLLSGGILQPVRAGAGWPILTLPAAGDAGRAWFECVRRQLHG